MATAPWRHENLTLTRQEQFALYLHTCELREMLNDLSRPAYERIMLAPDFFRCARILRMNGVNFWTAS